MGSSEWCVASVGEIKLHAREPGERPRLSEEVLTDVVRSQDWSKVKDLEVIMDREAAPVAGDDCYMALFRPLLAGTTLEAEPLRLAYSATEDGWTPEAFHSKVDGYGSAVVLARSEGGALFGGYNPLGYDGFGQKSSMGAFLFTWPDGDASSGGSTRKKPFKLPKVQTDQLAVVDNADAGPQVIRSSQQEERSCNQTEGAKQTEEWRADRGVCESSEG